MPAHVQVVQLQKMIDEYEMYTIINNSKETCHLLTDQLTSG